MLPKKQRLQRPEVKLVMRFGRLRIAPGLNLKLRANHLPVSRWTVVVSTKIAKQATKRNRLKRRLRAMIQKQTSSLKPGFDIVLLTKSGILDLANPGLEALLLSLLTKAGLVRSKIN